MIGTLKHGSMLSEDLYLFVKLYLRQENHLTSFLEKMGSPCLLSSRMK